MLDRLRDALIRRLGTLSDRMVQAPASVPDLVNLEALRAKGNRCIAEENMLEAEYFFREALAVKNDDSKSLVCLGYVLKEQSRLSEARVALKRAIIASPQAPDEHEIHYMLGQISEQQEDLRGAAMHFNESLRIKPDFSRACKYLCQLHEKLGELHSIRGLLEQCVSRSPQCSDYRVWLSDLCENEIDFQGVIEHLTIAVDLGVRTVNVYKTLGAALCRVGKVSEGRQTLELAEAMDPTIAAEKHYHIGYYHLQNGSLQGGLNHMENAISLRPDLLSAHSSILMALSQGGADGVASYRDAAQRFAQVVIDQIKKPLPERQPVIAEEHGIGSRKLRVGFVSGEFYSHPVTFFLQDVLKNLDKTKLHLVAYSNNAFDDAATESIQVLFDEWHSIRKLTDDDAAAFIFSHHIDILFDLGAHTGENRLAVFARRPAPTQVSWLGYWASTGLQEMDFIIGDPISSPVDSTEWFSERVYRLPHTRLCMAVPKTSREIAVGPPPFEKNTFITFGSFQQTLKINDKVLSVWAKVMHAIPQSRLRIQTVAINTPSMRDRLVQDIVKAGIDLSRVSLLPAFDLDSYLDAHNEVDVLLDTFPYPGGTTTAFALWMGVPTITLAGDTMLARQGACMLSCVGLSDLVASTETAYVETAVHLACDAARLRCLRRQLRADTLKSPLFDAMTFANDFQNVLFQMHQEKLLKTHRTTT